MTGQRAEKLQGLLPLKEEEYDYNRLSKVETAALVEALGDGFGDTFYTGAQQFSLPADISSGLVNHSFFLGPHTKRQFDGEDAEDAFWNEGDDGEPAPAEIFPLNFNRKLLRMYFQNQFDRFCWVEGYETNPAPEVLTPTEEFVNDCLNDRAARMLYQKPWYEFHAIQFLNWMENDCLTNHPRLDLLFTTSTAGKLGRLIEQYYWRFRFEEIATVGTKVRKGASAGGKAKADVHRAARNRWQSVVSGVWARHPDWSKSAVAHAVKAQCGDLHTARHIARYIVRS